MKSPMMPLLVLGAGAAALYFVSQNGSKKGGGGGEPSKEPTQIGRGQDRVYHGIRYTVVYDKGHGEMYVWSVTFDQGTINGAEGYDEDADKKAQEAIDAGLKKNWTQGKNPNTNPSGKTTMPSDVTVPTILLAPLLPPDRVRTVYRDTTYDVFPTKELPTTVPGVNIPVTSASYVYVTYWDAEGVLSGFQPFAVIGFAMTPEGAKDGAEAKIDSMLDGDGQFNPDKNPPSAR